jgi:hypothetical protein
MIRGMGRGEIDLGQAISEGVPAWGWHPLERRRKRIPSDHFRAEMIERKGVLPVSVAHQPKVVVDTHGSITTSPRQRSADYRGPRWEAIEIDFAALRQARPKRKPKCKLKRKPRRKAGPGRERIYNHEAITGAGNRVLARGRPDTKALFFEKIIAECRAAKIKLPPNIDVDDSLLRRVVGKLYDDAKDERHN